MQSYNEQIKDNHNTRQQTQQDKQNKTDHTTHKQTNTTNKTNTNQYNNTIQQTIQHNHIYLIIYKYI